MAVKTVEIKTYVDDLDGTEHDSPLGTYTVVDPETGKAWSLDLSEANFGKLVKALAPFLASETKQAATAPKQKTVVAELKRNTRDYDKVGFRKWAEANGKWTGKRPSYELIDEYEATLR